MGILRREVKEDAPKAFDIFLGVLKPAPARPLQSRAFEVAPLEHGPRRLGVNGGQRLKDMMGDRMVQKPTGNRHAVGLIAPTIHAKTHVLRCARHTVTAPVLRAHALAALAAAKKPLEECRPLANHGAHRGTPGCEQFLELLPHVARNVWLMMVLRHDPVAGRAPLDEDTPTALTLSRRMPEKRIRACVRGVVQRSVERGRVDRAPLHLPADTPWELQIVFAEVVDDLTERSELRIEVEDAENRFLHRAIGVLPPLPTPGAEISIDGGHLRLGNPFSTIAAIV